MPGFPAKPQRAKGGSKLAVFVLIVFVISVFYTVASIILMKATFNPRDDTADEEEDSITTEDLLAEDVASLLLKLHPELETASSFAKILEVPVESARTLSFGDFYWKYAITRTPVLFRDLDLGDLQHWNLSHIRNVCGEMEVEVLEKVAESKAKFYWAKVRPAEELPLKDFIDQIQQGKTKYYLHDWSMRKHCLHILDQFRVPKYFSNDYYQCYHGIPSTKKHVEPCEAISSWPSLFIGGKETASGLHVDSGSTHFWMFMIQGRKKWRIVSPPGRVLLGESRRWSSFQVDLFNPDFKRYPQLGLAEVYDVTLNPGELLWLPADCAHQVYNLDDITIGVSMNYVDASNVNQSIKQDIAHGRPHIVDRLKEGLSTGKLYTRKNPTDLPFELFRKQYLLRI